MSDINKKDLIHASEHQPPSSDEDVNPYSATAVLSCDALTETDEITLSKEEAQELNAMRHSTPHPLPASSIPILTLESERIYLNRYKVVQKVGKGGMGALYKVFDTQRQETIALKLLQDSYSTKHIAVERFKREIQALRRFQHPNIVEVYDTGSLSGVPYYTMEFLPGGTLRERLQKNGPLPWIHALFLMERIVHAIAHIHSFGLIHRDLKSENIMFRQKGTPIITDLGLSLILGQDESERLTERGYFVGTVHYMAPEQALNPNAVDERSDVYALGMLFYEMLTGNVPFAEKSGVEALKEILKGRVPALHTLNIHAPKSIIALCEKAMEHNREKRFSSSAEMLHTLRVMREVLESSQKA